MRHRRSVAMLVVAGAIIAIVGSGCGGRGGSSLDDAVRAFARTQAVDESVVRTALRQEVSGADEQLDLLRQWQAAVPDRPIPNVSVAVGQVDDLVAEALGQLRSAVCSALIDIGRTGEIPSSEQFVEGYLQGVVLSAIPYGELVGIAETFDQLWIEASQGTLEVRDIRLTLMSLQYC